jgi:hypothetical protein
MERMMELAEVRAPQVRDVRANLVGEVVFAEGRRDARTFWTEAAHHRLRRVKAAYDPGDLIRSNHPLD